MRKIISTLLLATCLPAAALAAPTTETETKGPCVANTTNCHGHKCGTKGTGHMAGLHLSAEQHQKMRTIMGERFKSKRDITKKYLDKLPETEKKAMKAELEASREKSDKAVRALLNTEQQKKYDEMKTKHEEHRKAWEK